MRAARDVTVVAVMLVASLQLTCVDRAASTEQLGRARLSELEQAEDVAWGILHDALARCRAAADGCDARRRAEFDTRMADARASIEARYRRLLDDFETRCRPPGS